MVFQGQEMKSAHQSS
jgi:hypothetical protein